jgi:hypothetical protein
MIPITTVRYCVFDVLQYYNCETANETDDNRYYNPTVTNTIETDDTLEPPILQRLKDQGGRDKRNARTTIIATSSRLSGSAFSRYSNHAPSGGAV